MTNVTLSLPVGFMGNTRENGGVELVRAIHVERYDAHGTLLVPNNVFYVDGAPLAWLGTEQLLRGQTKRLVVIVRKSDGTEGFVFAADVPPTELKKLPTVPGEKHLDSLPPRTAVTV